MTKEEAALELEKDREKYSVVDLKLKEEFYDRIKER